MTKRRIVIIGAGPIGLHAALRAVQDAYDVRVLEREDVGAAIMKWSHVRLFTPFAMNSTDSGRTVAAETVESPDPDELLTGSDYVNRYLRPLADSECLSGRIHLFTELVAAGRQSETKSSSIGSRKRSRSPFRLLVRHSDRREETEECDLLLDCTGLTARHRSIGAGGIPCPGETALLNDSDYRIVSPHDAHNEHVVVVGSGYSAATSVCQLHSRTSQITWITRGNRFAPLNAVPDDSLPERAALTSLANSLAVDEESPVRWLPGQRIHAIEKTDSGLRLTLTDETGQQQHLDCDRIIANPGYRPDTRPFEELQIHRCYATEGPMKMAAHLLGEASADCVSQTAPGIELLRNPEPGFFILGSASYGRDSRFLLKNGLEQVEQLFDSLLPARETAS